MRTQYCIGKQTGNARRRHACAQQAVTDADVVLAKERRPGCGETFWHARRIARDGPSSGPVRQPAVASGAASGVASGPEAAVVSAGSAASGVT